MKSGIAKLWGNEPTAILGILQGALTLGVTFGLHLSAEQIGAILAFSTALVTVLARAVVSSPTSVAKQVAAAKASVSPLA